MLAVLLVLVGAEALARRLEPDYLLKTRGLHVRSAVYGWEPKRDVLLVMDGQRITLGSLGQRGGPLRRERRATQRRVVVLGDSIAFGVGVSDSDTFAQVLEASVHELEVINLAVQGYGTDQAYLRLRREALGLSPDIVLLAFCGENDVADNVRATYLYDGRTPKPFFTLDDDQLRLHDEHLRTSASVRLGQWLADHCHLYVRLLSLWPPAAVGRGPAGRQASDGLHWGERRRLTVAQKTAARRLTFRIIQQMAIECRAKGVRFLVAFFPNRSAFEGRSNLPDDFRSSSLLQTVERIDLTLPFRASGLRFEELTLDRIGHLNCTGHRLVAQLVGERLRTGAGRGR